MIGKAKMEMKVSLTFACLNLKKLANMLDMRDKNPRIKAIFCKIMANIDKIFELSSKKAECSV